MIDTDISSELQQAVIASINDGVRLQLLGGNSKAFYGRETQAEILAIKQHQGIVNYQPSELLITARAGTLLSDIEQQLAQHGQMLAFEPPHFGTNATLGGAIACGLSGPRRPFAGAARDFMLGCKIINGKGEVLQFGGEVMKNVAGYDVSRLMVGAMGTLGVLLEVSLKVMPIPAHEQTCCLQLPLKAALKKMLALSSGLLPVSALCYSNSALMIRFSGAEQAVQRAVQETGAELLTNGATFWTELREQQLDFFQANGDLWRLSVPPATPVINLPGDTVYDWGGALRWLKSDVAAQQVFQAAQQYDGHATLFRTAERQGDIFQPLPDTLKKIHFNIKKAFDPNAIFNPHRMYKEW